MEGGERGGWFINVYFKVFGIVSFWVYKVLFWLDSGFGLEEVLLFLVIRCYFFNGYL